MIQVTRIAIGAGRDHREIAVKARAGGTPGLIWLGGFGSDMEGSKALAVDDFAERHDLAATRFDYSGHGISAGSFEEGTIGRWAAEAEAVLDRTTGRQILIGSSMGGWIALLLARKPEWRDRIAGLVLIAPAADFTEKLMWPKFSDEQRRRLTEEGRLELPSPYGPQPTVITRGLIEDGRRHQVLDAALEIHAPVRILQGGEDPDVPWRHALLIMNRLTGCDVTFTLIRDGDHRLSRQEDLDRLSTVLGEMTGRSRPG